MRSCPRSPSPGDTGAPRAQPSEALPPAPGLAVIATPDRVTTLRSWGLLMGSVPGFAGHPAAAVAAGRDRAIVPAVTPAPQKPAENRSAPHAATSSRLPAPGKGASGSGEIPWGSPGTRCGALSPCPSQEGMLSPKSGIFIPREGVHVLPTAPKASVAAHPSRGSGRASFNACKGPV